MRVLPTCYRSGKTLSFLNAIKRGGMGFKTEACKCPVCGKAFKAEAYQVRYRVPSCSRSCEQERRHKAGRDAKWAMLQEKIVNRFI